MNWLIRIFEVLLNWIRRLIERILEWFERNSGGGGTIPDDKCCYLARTDNECKWLGGKSNFTCPPGENRLWWYCCEGTQQIACGECTPGSSCYSGPWSCSIWWYTGATC